MGRITVMQIFHTKILPILTRYKAGTLDTDIRRTLIQHVIEEGCVYSSEVDWKLLVERPQFAGHTAVSLCRLYQTLCHGVIDRHDMELKKVTIQDVEKYWFTSVRKQHRRVRETEELIVATYSSCRKL